MSFRDIISQRNRFQPDPHQPVEPELPLLEKQAIVDEVFRGMPLRDFEVYSQEAPGGTIFYVTKGWARLSALFDFADDKFPTWDVAAMKRWQQQQK